MSVRSEPSTAGHPAAPDPRRWLVLVLMGLALCVIVLNNSALNVALPSLMADLDADLPTVQWIVDGYSIVFAGLLIPAGAWSDRWGRKRLTLAGLAVFGAASLLATQADTAGQLIALRGLLGAMAAFVMPGTLAVLLHAFPARERGTAIAVWSAVAALGVAIGPVLGGLLVGLGGWSAVFLVNVPLVVAVVVTSAFVVRESADPQRRPADLVASGLVVVTIGALVFAVIELGATGTAGVAVLVPAAVAVVGAILLVRRQRTARHPLVDRAMLADRRFAGAAVVTLLLFFGLAGSMFVLTQRLQLQLGFEPLQAGLAVGPVALTVVAASAAAGLLAARAGARIAVSAALLLVAAGFAVLALPSPSYGVIVAGLVCVGTGFGLAMPTATTVLVSVVPHDRAGSGTAVNDTVQELGFALGIAVIGAVQHRMAAAGAFDAGATAALLGCTAAALAGVVAAATLLPAGAPDPGAAERTESTP